MTLYTLLLFGHILLLVFWLGTDVGVFLAAKLSEKSDLSVETRATVLRLGMILDRLPRSALTLIVPSGLQLGVWSGVIALPPLALGLAWLVGVVWLVILWSGFLNPETALEQRAMLINFVLNAIAAVVVSGYAIYLLASSPVATWFALKLLAVGIIFVFGVLLDVKSKPAVEAFFDIVTNGATPERDARYSAAIGPVYIFVLAIYALVLAAAYLGVAKPFF